MAKILIDSGLKDKLPLLAEGEFYFCNDTNELFIGNSKNNILLNPPYPDTDKFTFWSGTQNEYDSITTKDSSTIYFIIG